MKPAYLRVTEELTGDVHVERIARTTLINFNLYDEEGNRLPEDQRGLTEEEIGQIYLLEPGETLTLERQRGQDIIHVITCLEYTQDDIPNTNEIQAFAHCGLCMAENPPGQTSQSMEEYARLSVGMTPIGMQVWCVRHNVNVMHIDYMGHRLTANSTRQDTP